MKKSKQQIKKININLFPENIVSKSIYEKEKAKYIAEYEEYVKSTKQYYLFFSTGQEGHYKKSPVLGNANWNRLYPLGYEDWAKNRMTISSYGQQQIIDKINELCEIINKPNKI